MSMSLHGAVDMIPVRPPFSLSARVAREILAVTGTTQPHILVIDEEPAILDLVRELLEGEGFAVSTRQRATPDLREIKALGPDLIIFDSLLSLQAGGDSLFQLLKRDRETVAIPLVLCSGDLRELADRGCFPEDLGLAVIPKPFDIAGFVAVVREALHA
jgi:DNA-binding response OmpR family regulator